MRANVVAFRATRGRLGNKLGGADVLLLDHLGRRSGKKRTTPLIYIRDGEDVVVVASKGGAPQDPLWWLNLKAHPDTTVQIGAQKLPVTARQASPEEKNGLWPRLNEVWPDYDAYQRRTDRDIPVVILGPR